MELHSVPPDDPSAPADGSQRTASDEHEQYASDYGAQYMYRSRKRTKFVSFSGIFLLLRPINENVIAL
jgi:hypothetical protein